MTKSNSKKIRELQNIEKNSTSEDEIGLNTAFKYIVFSHFFIFFLTLSI